MIILSCNSCLSGSIHVSSGGEILARDEGKILAKTFWKVKYLALSQEEGSSIVVKLTFDYKSYKIKIRITKLMTEIYFSIQSKQLDSSKKQASHKRSFF